MRMVLLIVVIATANVWIVASSGVHNPDRSLLHTAAPAAEDALDGHIRAYRSESGAIVWDYNTVVACPTVNGVAGQGGAIDGPAPVISRGMLFVNSGYGMFGEKPGNVLLAFTVR